MSLPSLRWAARLSTGIAAVTSAPDGFRIHPKLAKQLEKRSLMLDEDRVVTKALDGSFLHGVTRDSVLVLAAEEGLTVEERDINRINLEHGKPVGRLERLPAWFRRIVR